MEFAFAHALVLGFSTLPTPPPGMDVCPFSHSENWAKYFSYTGNLSVTGKVSASTVPGDGDSTMMWYRLSGVDPACAGGPDTSASVNSCGIHIHVGGSCESDAGGHYFMNDPDPWGAGFYTAPPSDETIGWFVVPNTGLSASDITGKTVIVHAVDGSRIACALLSEPVPENSVGPFTKYFNYLGELPQGYESYSGGMTYSTPVGTTWLYYSVSGVDPACEFGADESVANSCGIHIHAGTSCDEDALGHYFREGLEDPWATVSYTSLDNPVTGVPFASGLEGVDTGFYNVDIGGRVLIVHDRTGARIMCAPIQPTDGAMKLGKLSPYPGYTGDLMVEGVLSMIQPPQREAPLTMSYQLRGLDPRCAPSSGQMPTKANACGIHVHEGYSCEEAGGHLYASDIIAVDPWTTITALQSEDGSAISPSQVVSPLGLPPSELIGRAFVIHDFEGARISCGIVYASKTDQCWVGMPHT